MSKINKESFVYSENKGLTQIKNVCINDRILSKNNVGESVYTNIIDKRSAFVDNGTVIKFHCGSELSTTEDSCIQIFNRTIDDNLEIIKNINAGNYCYRPNYFDKIRSFDNSLGVDGWFCGMHTGDGTSDRKLIKLKNSEHYTYRLRILGDNQNTILEYGNFVNFLTGRYSKINSKISEFTNSETWDYSKNGKDVYNIIEKYFDGNFGNKTYSGDVYSFVENKNLWIPFIAGLVDSDSYVKHPGNLRFDMCKVISMKI